MAEIIPPDPFRALGVDKTATADEIKKAYRKAALRCHPDKTKDQAKIDEFHRIQQAYDILGDDEKRRTYEAQLRLLSLRKDIGRSSSYATSPREAPWSAARPTSYHDTSRARGGWTAGWSSTRPFRSEERVPPKQQPEPVPQSRPPPSREPTFEDDFLDRNELNRSTSRKDDSYYSASRRPAQPKPAKSEAPKSSKTDKTSPKDKQRRDMQKQREREKEREREKKYGPPMGVPTAESDSSDDGYHRNRVPSSRTKQQQFQEPRRRSDTTGLKEAIPRESRRSDEDDSLDGRHRRKYADKEDFVYSYRLQSGDAPRTRSPPPGSYRAPAEPDANHVRRSSSTTARPGLVRRASTSTKAPAAKPTPSRPSSRRPSPVRRASRSYEDLEPAPEIRRPPPMPTSRSSPTGANIKLPEDKRGRSYDLPRSRPSIRHADTMPSPRSSAERIEQEERDRLYERSDREKSDRERSDRERSSGRVKLSRSDSDRVNLERSSSGGRRAMPRRPHGDDATPVVSSGLRHGENNDSGYSTSSPSETPVEHFPVQPPTSSKSKVYQYAKVEDAYVAEVRAPVPTPRRTSSPVREKQTSYPPSAAMNDRIRRPSTRASSYSTQPSVKPGLVRRGSYSHRGEPEEKPRSGITRGETMPPPSSHVRDYPIPPISLQTGYKVSDGTDGHFFGELPRANSPEEMSPRDTSRRDAPSYRIPATDKVAYAKYYDQDDVAYTRSGPSIGRRNSSARATTAPTERYHGRAMRSRREAEAY